MIEVESGIPIPAKNPGRNPLMPFDQLDVGQSFLREGAKETSLRSSKNYWEKKLGKKFTIRKVSENSFRIWRTK